MESTYILLEYYKIHNPEKLSGLKVSSKWPIDVPTLINKYSDDYDYLFDKMQKKYGTNPRDEIPLPKVELPEKPVTPVNPEKETGDDDNDEYSDYSYSEYEEEEKPRSAKPSGAKSSGFMDDVDNMFSNFFTS